MYDLEEQEQIDALKAWWAQYGRWVWLGGLLLMLLVGAIQGWRAWQNHQAQNAGVLFEAVQGAVLQRDITKSLQAVQALETAQPQSPLTTRAAFLVAALAHEKSDGANARQMLQWVVLHGKEPALVDLARLREAGLLADEKKYDEALRLLQDNHGPEYLAMSADLRGDILLAQNKPDEARQSWRQALEKTQPVDVVHQIVQGKLDALGGSK